MQTTATSPIKRAASPITSLLESFPPGKRSEALIHSLRLGMVVSDSLRSPVENTSSPSKITELSTDTAIKEQKAIEKKQEKKIVELKAQINKVENEIKESTPRVVKVS